MTLSPKLKLIGMNLFILWLSIVVHWWFFFLYPAQILIAYVYVFWEDKRTKRSYQQYIGDQRHASTYGVYFIEALDPNTLDDKVTLTNHLKMGYGNVEQCLQTHRTALGPMRVRGVIYTKTKHDARELERRVKNELERAGMLIPYDGNEQRAIEVMYAREETYRIIDDALTRVGATINTGERSLFKGML